jgi:hypothetical protein
VTFPGSHYPVGRTRYFTRTLRGTDTAAANKSRPRYQYQSQRFAARGAVVQDVANRPILLRRRLPEPPAHESDRRSKRAPATNLIKQLRRIEAGVDESESARPGTV